MRHFLFAIVLSILVSHCVGDPKAEPTANTLQQKYGSHNLLKLEISNSSVNRAVRCTPCGTPGADRKPISNQLNPEYRGNGADNLGYDWSPMAWGGPAFPQRSKRPMGGMRGRDGKQMPGDWGRDSGNVRVICDTCRAYWEEGNIRDRGSDRGPKYSMSGQQTHGGSQPGYWQDGRTAAPAADFETRVSSPTVGVLVKPGSRIAYVPSRSGEMYWDGVSGGGTRWDGFSNGISWVNNGPSEWDRSDTGPREEKPGLGPGTSTPDGDASYNSNSFRPWDYKGNSGWNDNSGKGYYFANGAPNQMNPHRTDRGYASNWHYGSTNEFGWNGNNMKWNYGGKQWEDNDRAANRFYFNSPQDRTYGPAEGNRYGNRYPNYQPSSAYPANFRPRPSWRPDGGNRVNDRDPSNFPLANYGHDDKNRPWDYNSRYPFGSKRPESRPEWLRPGPNYPLPAGFDKDGSGKFQGPYREYSPKDTYPAPDKNQPWNRPSGYGVAKPGSGGGFPYGGNRYPGDSGVGRPNYPGNHLFYPSDGAEQPSYPSTDYESGGSGRPTYQSSGERPGGYPSTANQIGSYLNINDPSSVNYQGGGKPSVTYTGGRPSGGGSTAGYPGTGSSIGYPSGGGSGSAYPNQGDQSNRYPSAGSSSGGYPENGGRPGSGGSYPTGPGSPGGYPGSGRPSGHHPSGGSSYPSEGSYSGVGGYSNGGARPGGYPGGGYSFQRPGGSGFRPGGTAEGGYPNRLGRPNAGDRVDGYSGTRPIGYPTGDFSSGSYPVTGNRPAEYQGGDSGGRPLYPIRGQPGHPGSNIPGGGYSQGGKNPPKGYYTGFITELDPYDGYTSISGKYPNHFEGSYSDNKNSYTGKDKEKYPYRGDSGRYPYNDKNRYPAYPDDRYSEGGGGSYPVVNKGKYPNYNGNGDRFYYGQSSGKDKYPGGYSSNQGFSGSVGEGDYNGQSGSNGDKNSWNYDLNERKEGIYRRSGGSYPPYRGGQYFTSSYLASMSTTSGSQEGAETKTQSVTKGDEVTQPTPA